MSGNRYCQSPQPHLQLTCAQLDDEEHRQQDARNGGETTFYHVIWSKSGSAYGEFDSGVSVNAAIAPGSAPKNTKEENTQQGVLLSQPCKKSGGATVQVELALTFTSTQTANRCWQKTTRADVLFSCTSQKGKCAKFVLNTLRPEVGSSHLIPLPPAQMKKAACKHKERDSPSPISRRPSSITWSQKWVTPLCNVFRGGGASCNTEGCH